MTAGTVSVIIPTRNRWDLLSRAALPAAFGQEDVDVEVIVVDDASDDGTSEKLATIGDPRLTHVRLDEPAGVARARNRGIAEARGEWVAFLDDDDVWSPRKLRSQLDAADAADADFAYARVISIDEMRRPSYVFPLPDAAELGTLLLAASELPAGCSNVLARTELVRSLGGFDEELHQLADWDLWIRLAWAGRAAAVDEVLVGYVQHDRNMLLSDTRDVVAELDYLDGKHRSLRVAQGVELDRAAFLHWVAWGHLRRRRRLGAARVYLRSARTTRSGRDLALAVAFAARAVLPLSGVRRTWQRVRGAAPAAVPAVEPDWLRLGRV